MNQEYKVPISNSLIVFREEFDDWAILFDPQSGKAFGINPIASLIWKRLDGKHKLEAILREIKESLLDVPDNVESEINEFLSELVENGFAGYEL